MSVQKTTGDSPVDYSASYSVDASQRISQDSPPKKKSRAIDPMPVAPSAGEVGLPLGEKRIRILPSESKAPQDTAKATALKILTGLRRAEWHERAERMKQNPPEPIQEVPVNQQVPNPCVDHICRAMDEVMHRPSDPQQGGIWYPDEFQAGLAQSGKRMPEDYLTGHANEEYFLKTWDEDEGDTTFTVKPGKRASEALLSFFRGPTIATCGMTSIACAYKALLDLYGAEKFDRMFTDENPLIIEDAASEDFFEETDTATHCLSGSYGNRPLKVGDLCRFENVPWYKAKHPGGCGDGLNCVYMGLNGRGEQVFGGLGLEKPSTEGEIYQWLIKDYNRPRDGVDHMLIKRAGGEVLLFPNTMLLRVFKTIDPELPAQLEITGFVSFVPEGAFRLRSDIDSV